MRRETSDPKALLPLNSPVYHILLALGPKSLHGYAIMQEWEELAGGKATLLPGTLYSTISRMVEAGLIEEVEQDRRASEDDSRRRYYRLTPYGRDVAQAESHRLSQLLGIAQRQGFGSFSLAPQPKGTR